MKFTVQLTEAREALARAQTTASRANGRAEEFASALRRQRADRSLELDAEWNAALVEAAERVLVGTCMTGCGHNGCISVRGAREVVLSLKREVKT